MLPEQWKPVVGYEGLYEVSSLGRVRSPLRLLSPFMDRGYPWVNLRRNGRCKKLSVHAIVLTAFVGPRPDGLIACHYDGNRANPALTNLRWDTYAANSADARRHGTHTRGEVQGQSVLTAELVGWIRESRQSSLALAHVLGVASSTVRAVRIGQNWRHAPEGIKAP